MGSLSAPTLKFAFRLQDVITVLEDPPVLNTYAIVFNLTGGCKLYYIVLIQTNGENANKDYDFRLTIDGVVYTTIGLTLLANEYYYFYLSDIGTGTAHILTLDASQPFPNFGLPFLDNAGNYLSSEVLEMTDFQLEARQTTALGTNQDYNIYYRSALKRAV